MNKSRSSELLSQTASPLRRARRKIIEIALCRTLLGRWAGRIPLFRRYYTALVMARQDNAGLYSGVYSSFEDAMNDAPKERLTGWDHDAAASLWLDRIAPVSLSTYPIFFWLGQVYRAADTLVDLGGSIGLTYYGYRGYASLPERAHWTVVEVPAIAAQGLQVALREKASDLTFLDSLAKLTHCDILLAAGTLQYMNLSSPGILESLPCKPRHVLLNKVPVAPQDDCWTLQNYGPAVTPLRLFNERKLLDYYADHGYRLRDRWVVQDLSCPIPFHPERFIKEFAGFHFELFCS